MGLTAIVGLVKGGEGAVTPVSSSTTRLFFERAVGTLPPRPPAVFWCALKGWKQFLQEPGFHTCSAKSLHADIFVLLNYVWSEVAVE